MPRRIAALLLVAGALLVAATVLPWLVLGPTSTSLWSLGEALAAVFTAIGAAAALTAVRALAGRTTPVAVGVAGALVCGVALAAPLDAGALGDGAGAGVVLALVAGALGAAVAAASLWRAPGRLVAVAAGALAAGVVLAVVVATHPEIQVIQ